jgi:hypothetical protein
MSEEDEKLLLATVRAIAAMTYSQWEESTPAGDACDLCERTLKKIGQPIPEPYFNEKRRFPEELD